MNSKSFVFGDIEANEANQVVSLFKESFPQQISKYLLFNCHGIGEYIQDSIQAQQNNGDTKYYGVKSDNKIVGCAEIKLSPEKIYLNYIAIDERYRSHKLSYKLLYKVLQKYKINEHQFFDLDVFDYNTIALSTYIKLGLTVIAKSNWIELQSPSLERITEYSCSGLPQAELIHRKYGFSQFIINTPKGNYSIGRLGDCVFRLINHESIPIELVSILNRIDNKRNILVISPIDKTGTIEGTQKEVLQSIHMSASINIVFDHLTNIVNDLKS